MYDADRIVPEQKTVHGVIWRHGEEVNHDFRSFSGAQRQGTPEFGI